MGVAQQLKMELNKILPILALVFIIPENFLLCQCVSKAPRLDSYKVNRSLISVSGLSSGGFFAVQYHVAYSKNIMGAAIVAGGPYFCAQGEIELALSDCMTDPDKISVEELITITKNTEATLTIDSTDNLASDHIYLFSGTKDYVVVQGVMKRLAEYYEFYTTQGKIKVDFLFPTVHGLPTVMSGSNCTVFGSPFVQQCKMNFAFNFLNLIYGDIKYGDVTAAVQENLYEYDQSEFFVDLPEAVSMDSTGYVYVPSGCQSKKTECRLHISYHGCLQGRKYVGTSYVMTDLSGLAEINNIIVLYPQAVSNTVNPRGCWDWWGYTGKDYACKLGLQMAGCYHMMERVAGM